MITGEDISALANRVTLHDREYAYMIWEPVSEGRINPPDPETAKRYMEYIPKLA